MTTQTEINDPVGCGDLRRFLASPGRYFDSIRDPRNIIARLSEVVRINSLTGMFYAQTANVQVRLTNGSEVTIDLNCGGGADGTYLEVL